MIETLKDWSEAVRERDAHTCQECGATADLQAHHVKPKAAFPDLALDIDNGQTLCRMCHSEAHSDTPVIRDFLRGTKPRPRHKRAKQVPVVSGGGMSAEAFEAWLAEMKAANLAETSRAAARLLDVHPNTVVNYRRTGCDRATALACTALLHRMEPYA